MTWQAGGWFGAQVGGTLWLLFLAVVLAGPHPAAAVVAGMSFVVANLFGWRLWRRRATLSARNATLILLGVEFAAGLISLIAADVSGALDGVVQPGPHAARAAGPAVYLNLLVFPLVGVVLWNVDRAMRKRPAFRLGTGGPRPDPAPRRPDAPTEPRA